MRGIRICYGCAASVLTIVDTPADKVNRFGLLPDEILCHIWSFLDINTALYSRSTCKMFDMLGGDPCRLEAEKMSLFEGAFVRSSKRLAMDYRQLVTYHKGCVDLTCTYTDDNGNDSDQRVASVHPTDTMSEIMEYYGSCQSDVCILRVLDGNAVFHEMDLNYFDTLGISSITRLIDGLQFYDTDVGFVVQGGVCIEYLTHSPFCDNGKHDIENQSVYDLVDGSFSVVKCPTCEKSFLMDSHMDIDPVMEQPTLFVGQVDRFHQPTGYLKFFDYVKDDTNKTCLERIIMASLGLAPVDFLFNHKVVDKYTGTPCVMFKVDGIHIEVIYYKLRSHTNVRTIKWTSKSTD
jgi:hypothetical protein